MAMLHYLKNMLQLLLSPQKGWEEVASDDTPVSALAERGFYPMLSIVSITAFLHGLYLPEKFDYAAQLILATAQFLSFFLGFLLARGAFEALMPQLSDAGRPDMQRVMTFILYSLGIMAGIQTVVNLCPMSLTLLWFLPLFVVLVIWNGRQYLEIRAGASLGYLALGVVMLIVLPILLNYLLSMLL